MTLLTRAATSLPVVPVGIVHLGVGVFHRAHQAWYTDQVDTDRRWGIAGFTGRTPDVAELLTRQEGLYTLIERGDHDRGGIVGALSSVTDGANVEALATAVAAPTTKVVTLTISEAGYTAWGVPGRLLKALDARRHADAGPIAIVPCDNLPAVGTHLAELLHRMADAPLATWMSENVSFVSTSVDRITPATTPADRGVAEKLTGFEDDAPVVTEPFHNWILSGTFPGGRPEWQNAGALFVDDIVPYEQRKLWLLNAGHSTLSYLGFSLGLQTVAEAIENEYCRTAVENLWAEASRHLPSEVDVAGYCAQLVERWRNPRIAHSLGKIAQDGLEKLRVRVVPVALLERAAGRDAAACATTIAAWMAVTGGTLRELSHELADDDSFVNTVSERKPA